MAVGAPASGDLDHQDLPLEPGIRVGYHAPVQIREAEPERFRRILHGGVQIGVGGLRKALGTGGGGTVSGHLGFAVLQDIQRAVARGCDFQQMGASPVEMAEHELAVLEGAADGPGVAVHAQDGRGGFRTRLLHDKAPCQLAFPALVGDFPQTVDGRDGTITETALGLAAAARVARIAKGPFMRRVPAY